MLCAIGGAALHAIYYVQMTSSWSPSISVLAGTKRQKILSQFACLFHRRPHRKLFAKQAAQANEEAVHSWLTAWVPADCLIIAGQLRSGSEKQATP
ncbi:hypothetical protein PF010_g28344 [Phytophthora fragariae]|uniref:Uncharacterized protein n=1 Tax=Phytophthora fragariae TaxID=53985 RepID=A0A6G0JRD2_9STRA|nr:hypothetical protein PF010_g28344 [Phytophthora fragariae]